MKLGRSQEYRCVLLLVPFLKRLVVLYTIKYRIIPYGIIQQYYAVSSSLLVQCINGSLRGISYVDGGRCYDSTMAGKKHKYSTC
jgi:hypothetical protein